MTDREKVPVVLAGVPETLLWNLYQRAVAARGDNPLLEDPLAMELVDRLDYPFERLAVHGGYASQWHALRVRCFDDEVRRFLAAHPGGTVVALGEGLETQIWRVDNGRVHWLTVDLPETVELRRQLLSDGPRQMTVACSATDKRWTRDASRALLVTAQGMTQWRRTPNNA